MGLFNNIKEKLPHQFSIFQFMSFLGIDAQEVRQARNILKQFYTYGYIKRIGKNMYEKIEKSEKKKLN